MTAQTPIPCDRDAIAAAFLTTRAATQTLAGALTPEDWMVQSMPDASPVKWNLAHTTWFYETFILSKYARGFEPFHPEFGYLFNSYYNQVGKMHPRPRRGLLSRPSAADVLDYRRATNAAVEKFLGEADAGVIAEVAPLFALGQAHEEQHQELLLTDIKHGLSQNPLAPAVYDDARAGEKSAEFSWRRIDGGLCEIGWNGEGFAFDNEGPRHKAYLEPFELANRPATNADYLSFIEDGGYADAAHWLSDAWDIVGRETWGAPLYWRKEGGVWLEYTLFGLREIDPHAPVCHVSYYEAAAFASWSGARLPTEFEWERASEGVSRAGDFLCEGRPRAPQGCEGDGLLQMFGDVWEWTASPYVAYPGYRTPPGAIGEYNGKFMSGQMVLRGGSCATPDGHIRRTYRNFFHPAARWQFSGIRLARDV